MVTNSIQHNAAVDQALSKMNLDTANGDTGLQVESAIDGNWVRLTSMRDGLQRPPIPQIHAARVLAKVLTDGSPAFWMEGMPYSPPEPQVGSIKCFFHPDFDEEDGPSGLSRQFIVDAGLGDFTCNSGDLSKQNRGDFKTVLMRDRHLRSRHRGQLEAIERAQGDQKEQTERAERQLDREYARQQTEAMMALLQSQIKTQGETHTLSGVGLPEVYRTATEAAPAVTVTEPAPILDDLPSSGIRSTRATKVMVPCTVEGCDFKGRGNAGVKAHMRMKIRHGDEAHVNAEAS